MSFCFVIDYAWISELLRDAAFTWRSRELPYWLKKWLISGNLPIWTVQVLQKVLFWWFWVLLHSKIQWQMFLLVSGRHAVGAHPDGLKHCLSMQISVYLGRKIYPDILLKENYCDPNLDEILCILTFFLFPDSRLYLLSGFDFFFIYFECCDTEPLTETTWGRACVIFGEQKNKERNGETPLERRISSYWTRVS